MSALYKFFTSMLFAACLVAAPGSIGNSDTIEIQTSTFSGNGPDQSSDLAFGALHVNVNKSNFMFFNGSGGTWTISGVTVGSLANAAFVNDSGQGFNVKATIVFDGGGDFVISHNSGSGGEFRGTLVTETNGAANLVCQGGGRLDFGNTVDLFITGDLTNREASTGMRLTTA